MLASTSFRQHFLTSNDGLKLYARDYGPTQGGKTPVLCLAGLTRNSKDFHKLAARISTERRVICPDYRGRGLSQYADDWKTYEPDVEMNDAIALLDDLGIQQVVLVGTSRGGLISMLTSLVHKDRLKGVVLNDIGPKIDDEGLIKIAESIGSRSKIDSWESLAKGMKDYYIGFSGLSDEDWMDFAHCTYREIDGEITPDYDFNLTKTFPTVELVKAGKIPEVWDMFKGFSGLPVGVIRGANSDLLSNETVAKMAKHHDGLVTALVPDRAHVPFLDEIESIQAVDTVLELADE